MGCVDGESEDIVEMNCRKFIGINRSKQPYNQVI